MEAYNIKISTSFDTQTGLCDIQASSELFDITLCNWDGDILEGIKFALDIYQEELDERIDRSLPLD